MLVVAAQENTTALAAVATVAMVASPLRILVRAAAEAVVVSVRMEVTAMAAVVLPAAAALAVLVPLAPPPEVAAVVDFSTLPLLVVMEEAPRTPAVHLIIAQPRDNLVPS